MDTRTLIDMVNTRIEANGDNPTSKSFFYEIIKALEELEQYRSADKQPVSGTQTALRDEDTGFCESCMIHPGADRTSNFAFPQNTYYTPLGKA